MALVHELFDIPSYIRAWISPKFCKVRPQTTKLAARRLIMGKQCLHVFLNVFDTILFILAGNKNIHKCLNAFGFRSDPTTAKE